ncbi:MAG: helix-turn-helix domain-containing protein [Thermoprotei archaeon]
MAIEKTEALDKLFPLFHGQSARILAYVAVKGEATPEEIRGDLGIPRSTVYKLLSELFAVGLASKERRGKVEVVKVPDFVVFAVTAAIGKLRVTPWNIPAFDAAHLPAGKMFIERHGLGKFARFVELYDSYIKGNTTARLMARELGVTRYEVEILLSDIGSMYPWAMGLAAHHGRRQ